MISTKKRSHDCTEDGPMIITHDGMSYKFDGGILIGSDLRENIVISFCSVGDISIGDVVCLIERDEIIYSGHKSGYLCRWVRSEYSDETGFCEFYSQAHEGSILYFAVMDSLLYSYGEDGMVCVWDQYMTCVKKVQNVKDPKSQIEFEKLLESHNFTNEIKLCDCCHDRYNMKSRYCCKRCPTHFDLCQRCSTFLSTAHCPLGHGCNTGEIQYFSAKNTT
jgi:hypothetical protein